MGGAMRAMRWEARKRIWDNRLIWGIMAGMLIVHLLLPVPEGWTDPGWRQDHGTVTAGLIVGTSAVLGVLGIYGMLVYPTLSVIRGLRRPWDIMERMTGQPFGTALAARLALGLLTGAASALAMMLETAAVSRFNTEAMSFFSYRLDLGETARSLWQTAVMFPVMAAASCLCSERLLSRKAWSSPAAVMLFLLFFTLRGFLLARAGSAAAGFCLDLLCAVFFFYLAVRMGAGGSGKRRG